MKNQISFSERCYQILKRVPKGKVTTYSAIAHIMGAKAYQAVGNAMNKNPHAPEVPCNRVINANGKIGGFAYGTKRKIQMLRQEGIEIINNKIDLEKYEFKF